MGGIVIAACGGSTSTNPPEPSPAIVSTQPSPPSPTTIFAPAPQASGPMEFELFVSDWTNNVPPPTDAFVVVEGVESWTPDLEFGGDVHSFGEFKIVNRAPFSSTPTVTVVPRSR